MSVPLLYFPFFMYHYRIGLSPPKEILGIARDRLWRGPNASSSWYLYPYMSVRKTCDKLLRNWAQQKWWHTITPIMSDQTIMPILLADSLLALFSADSNKMGLPRVRPIRQETEASSQSTASKKLRLSVQQPTWNLIPPKPTHGLKWILSQLNLQVRRQS